MYLSYQIEVALERTEFLGAKVLGKNRGSKLCHIEDTESFPRRRPGDHLSVIGRGFKALGFFVKHLVKPTRELLRYASLARPGEREVGEEVRCVDGCGHCVFDFCRLLTSNQPNSHMRKFVALRLYWNAFSLSFSGIKSFSWRRHHHHIFSFGCFLTRLTPSVTSACVRVFSYVRTQRKADFLEGPESTSALVLKLRRMLRSRGAGLRNLLQTPRSFDNKLTKA